MFFLRRAPLVLCLLAAGCVRHRTPQLSYVATVEQVDDLPWEHYSVAQGLKPLTCIRVNLIEPTVAGQLGELRILAMGLHAQDAFGRSGDQVSFRYSGRLPLAGEIWIEQLTDYRIRRER
jgi:hypothetical protein